MCKRLIYLISFVLVLSLAGSAQAVNVWTGASSVFWNDAGNWSFGYVPVQGSADGAVIEFGPGPIVQAADMGGDWIGLRYDSNMTIDGGVLTATRHFNVSKYAGTATLTLNTGTINVGHQMFVGKEGTGILDMYGGTITVPGGYPYGRIIIGGDVIVATK